MAAIVINVAGSYDNKALAKAKSELDKLGGQAEKTNGKFGGVMKGLGLVALGAGVAVGVAGKALWDWGKEAQAAAGVTRATEAIIKATGGTAGVTAAQVGKLADAISAKTGIDDEAIQSASNLLLTFKNVQNAGEGQAAMFDRATMAAADLSKAGFGSMDGAAKMLGKALNNPTKGIGALSKAGVTFTDQQKEQIKALQASGDLLGAQAVIMAEVESQVGGVAEATASPFERLETMLGNFKETVGAAVLPAITKLADAIGPVLDKLSGPLASIAGELAGVFTEVFASIAPLLPTLGEAIGQIVSVLGGALMTAIKALLPAVTPLLGVLAQLAQQIGPILAPVLETIGQLIGMIFQAVAPLLAPLGQLITTILGTAAQILMPVGQALMAIVSALTPIFAALVPILPLFGQLITMLGTILTPILTALTPLISMVAGVLADILGRAIGLTITGVGGLIEAMSYVAPFILNNVTRPVVGFFLQMAEGIIGAAASAFSWVPGLGDKLEGAKTAIATFATEADKGIANAATTIETQGRDIGHSLRLAGEDLLKNGVPAAKTAGTGFGSATVAAVTAKTPEVKAAGRSMGTQLGEGAETATRNVSPAVRQAGQDMGRGLGDGAIQAIRDQIPEVERQARDMGRRAAQAVKDGAQVSSPSKVTYYVGSMVAAGLRQGILDNIGQATRVARDAATEALGAIQQRAQKFLDFMRGIKDQMVSFGSITAFQPGEGVTPTASGLIGDMRARLAQVKKFGAQLAQLKKLGLNNTSLQEIISAGPTAGSEIAAALLKEGQRAVSQVNQLETQLAASGAAIGQTGAQSQFRTNMTNEQARGIVTTNVTVRPGAVTVNVGAGTSATDRAAIQAAVNSAIRQALTEYGREQQRQGSS